MLGKVVLRYLDGMDEPLINSIQGTLRATMGGRSVASAEDIATLQSLCQEVGCPYHDELRSTSCCVALVVLWMGLHQEKFPLLATTLQAAGVSGSQRWALILPSSARVSLVTYTAVIAVRYPELDNVQNDLVCFGNYLLGANYCSGTKQPSHVEGAHDDAQLLGSCKCHCCTGIGFFKLSKDFLLREFFHTPAPTTTEKSDLCLCQENEVSSHACTGCNALGLNRTL